MLPNGFLIHLGRKDFMVKIRGYRVEPSEIESALLAYPQVRQAGVVAWDREPGEKHLVAYVVPRDGVTPTISELHNFLMGKLPEYMMPSSYVFLGSLPLTNGKLDRSLLPLPDNKRPDMGHPYVPPHTDVEQSLVKIWQEILDIRSIGIHDDFFDLGGHSLLASRLFVKIEKAFGKQLPLTTLFWARNVEQLARIIQHEEWSAPRSLLFPIQPSGSKPPFFWVYGATSDVLLPRYLGPDQPLYGLIHEARSGKRVRYIKLNDIAANHLKDIQTVQPQGPYFLGGFCFGGMVAFEMAQQLQKQGQEVALLFLVDLGTLGNWRSRFEKRLSFRHRVSRHSRNLARIGVREAFKYVKDRVEDRIRGGISRGKKIAETVARNAYFISGRPLPPLLRPHYVSAVDQWAMQHYEPEGYSGDLILFKSEAKSYDPAWVARFTAGKLHLHELPCSHDEIIKDPHVSVWANQLKSYLHNAQATRRGTQPSVSPIGDNEDSL
jgi:thioesterase domain-containing protein/acyl carrier protein